VKKRRARSVRPRRRARSQAARRGVTLGAIAELFTPKPYDETEAAVDALSGKAACPHGQWPHQKAMCARCAAEVAMKAWLKILRP